MPTGKGIYDVMGILPSKDHRKRISHGGKDAILKEEYRQGLNACPLGRGARSDVFDEEGGREKMLLLPGELEKIHDEREEEASPGNSPR